MNKTILYLEKYGRQKYLNSRLKTYPMYGRHMSCKRVQTTKKQYSNTAFLLYTILPH